MAATHDSLQHWPQHCLQHTITCNTGCSIVCNTALSATRFSTGSGSDGRPVEDSNTRRARAGLEPARAHSFSSHTRPICAQILRLWQKYNFIISHMPARFVALKMFFSFIKKLKNDLKIHYDVLYFDCVHVQGGQGVMLKIEKLN